MDFDEYLEVLVANSFRSYDEDDRRYGQRVLAQFGGSGWLLGQLKTEAEETRVCLFDAGVWDDASRTAIVSAPQDDEVEKRVIYPLDDKPVGRSNFCLDSCARIWMRGHGNRLQAHELEEFGEEPEIVRHLIDLLREARLSVAAS